jgi:hypothetical protein
MYSAFIGFVVTFVIGYLLSYILRALKKQGPGIIFIDDSKTIVNADLFMQPKAKYIRRRNMKIVNELDGLKKI